MAHWSALGAGFCPGWLLSNKIKEVEEVAAFSDGKVSMIPNRHTLTSEAKELWVLPEKSPNLR